jgi:hypothetical protein
MPTRISRNDIADADIVDAGELSSDGNEVYKTGSIVRITGSFLTASFSAADQGFVDFDDPASGNDIVYISGSGNADGYYQIQNIVSENILQVSGSFSGSGTSTGSWSLIYAPGAKAVGFDPTTFAFSSSVPHDMFGFAKETTYQRLLEGEPAGFGVNENLTYSGNKVTKETYTRAADGSKIKTIDYTYTGNFVTQELRKVYAEDGIRVVAQKTLVYTYQGANAITVSSSRDI